MSNPFDHPEAKKWLADVERDMLPKMEDSAISITIFSGTIDAKLCVEVGAAILYDKPIVLLALPGQKIPAALGRAASAIVRGDPMRNPEVGKRLTEAIQLEVLKLKKEK
jgi:hypothetical protein